MEQPVEKISSTAFDASINKAKEKAARTGGVANVAGSDHVVAFVYPTGVVTFYARVPTGLKTPSGKPKYTTIKIGDAPRWTLAKSREKAKDLYARAKAAPPASPAKAAPSAPSLGAFLDDWFPDLFKTFKRTSNRAGNLRSLRHYLAPLEGVPLDAITYRGAYEAIRSTQTTDGNKKNAFDLLKQALFEAVRRGILTSNPIVSTGARSSPFKRPPVQHHKTVSADKLRTAYFEPLSTQPALRRAYFLFQVLTASRPGESLQIEWSWVDDNAKLIHVPGGHFGATKTNPPHEVPITPQLARLIETIRKCAAAVAPESPYMFPSVQKGKAMGYTQLSTIVRERTNGAVQLHGLRATFRSWLSISKVTDFDTAEMCISHEPRSEVVLAYDRASYMPRIRAAMEKWNDYVETMLPPAFLELLGKSPL